jgi:hypothetical protein
VAQVAFATRCCRAPAGSPCQSARPASPFPPRDRCPRFLAQPGGVRFWERNGSGDRLSGGLRYGHTDCSSVADLGGRHHLACLGGSALSSHGTYQRFKTPHGVRTWGRLGPELRQPGVRLQIDDVPTRFSSGPVSAADRASHGPPGRSARAARLTDSNRVRRPVCRFTSSRPPGSGGAGVYAPAPRGVKRRLSPSVQLYRLTATRQAVRR